MYVLIINLNINAVIKINANSKPTYKENEKNAIHYATTCSENRICYSIDAAIKISGVFSSFLCACSTCLKSKIFFQ